MKAIIETVYKIVKQYMLSKAQDTGNQQFVNQLNVAFANIENVWSAVNAAIAAKK